MESKKFKLFFGCLGHGVTVCNSATKENGDYKTLAHISPAGNIKFYVSRDYIPAEDMQRIEETAARMKGETRHELNRRLNITKTSRLDSKYAAMQEEHERGRILNELSNYMPWEKFDSFFETYKAAGTKEEKNAVIIETYLENF